MKYETLSIHVCGKYVTLIQNQAKLEAIDKILQKVDEVKAQKLEEGKEHIALEHHRESYRKALKMPDYVSGTKADVCAWTKTVNTNKQKKGKSVVKSEILLGKECKK